MRRGRPQIFNRAGYCIISLVYSYSSYIKLKPRLTRRQGKGTVTRRRSQNPFTFETVPAIDAGFDAGIFLCELFRLAKHPFDVLGRQAASVSSDGNLFTLSGALVFRTDARNAVGVDFERDVKLRDPTRRRRNPTELKFPQYVVVFGQGALPLRHLNENAGLVVLVRGKGLRLLRWDGGVAVDEFREDPASSFDALREGRDVQQDNIAGLVLS